MYLGSHHIWTSGAQRPGSKASNQGSTVLPKSTLESSPLKEAYYNTLEIPPIYSPKENGSEKKESNKNGLDFPDHDPCAEL